MKNLWVMFDHAVRVDYGSKGKLTIYVDNNLATVIGFTIEKPSESLSFSFEGFTDRELASWCFIILMHIGPD